MIGITETSDHILLQNKHAQIYISKADASARQIIDLKSGKNILAETAPFFALVNEDGTFVPNTGVTVSGNVLEIATALGSFSVQVAADEDYFAFTLLTALPEGAYKAYLGSASYDYDYTDKENTGACGISMTYWADPVFFPDSKDRQTRCEVMRHLKDVGAKYGLIIAPIILQQDIIKKVCLTIDKTVGLVSKIGGAWGRDHRLNFTNYYIEWETKREYVEPNIPFYKMLGIDQVDFHQHEWSYRQGDFKFERYANGAEFKKNVTDVLAKEGMQTGLHTYSFYIRYDCDTLLADPRYQKDLGVLETFVLSRDIDAEATFVPTTESTEKVSNDYGFQAKNTPFILVGEELMKFENAPDGFKIVARGVAGTKAVAHKAGEEIRHIDGYYRGIAPVPGSELFLQVARCTAKAFNEGGFTMIYLDALDGIRAHCADDEKWFYIGMFICELLQHCDKDPLIEYSCFPAVAWNARGRVGAYDYPTRGYKDFLKIHADDNAKYIDRYSAPTLGWYDFFPRLDKLPPNEHVKYQHADVLHYMGSLAVMHDFSIVHAATLPEWWPRFAGLRRNGTIYKQYDDLRKAQYFSQEYLEKLRSNPYECHVKEKEDGSFVFEEKLYKTAKFHNLEDGDLNTYRFNNPFDGQVPFIRIEALFSSAGSDPMTLINLDENKDLSEQTLNVRYDEDIDLNKRFAKKVRVKGNGIKGSAIAIRTRWDTFASNRGYLDHVIDTDFEGWKDFTLMESDVAERPDLGFDKGQQFYATYRSQSTNRMFSTTEILTAGDTTGVRMGDVVACKHIYEVLQNPTVQIGDTKIWFECDLKSTDYIEFDGKTAKVYDRLGNAREVWFETTLAAPAGEFDATLTATPLNGTVARAQLTLGFTGKEL